MNIIIPMAGRGSRLRPHTLTVPKPLVPVGGKSIVHRLVEDIAGVLTEKIDEIAFVIGDFGSEVELELIELAEKFNAQGSIYYQKEALGTAHAIYCAKEKLNGPTVVAYADTLFRADFKISTEDDGILWVKQIDDPSAFGVIKMNAQQEITDFVEKPQEFVSDLAMIGVYYFKEGERLKDEIKYLMDNNIIKSGEYQLPDALRRLVEDGVKFKPGKVDEWLDCGNKKVTVETNQRVLEFDYEKGVQLVHHSANISNSTIIPPCFIGENVVVKNSVIGPHVSIGANTTIKNVIIKNSIVQRNVSIEDALIHDSMLGNQSKFKGNSFNLSLGDFSELE